MTVYKLQLQQQLPFYSLRKHRHVYQFVGKNEITSALNLISFPGETKLFNQIQENFSVSQISQSYFNCLSDYKQQNIWPHVQSHLLQTSFIIYMNKAMKTTDFYGHEKQFANGFLQNSILRGNLGLKRSKNKKVWGKSTPRIVL